jgi:HTH-type transcriptional regulator/antitoxin HipB
MEHTTEYQRQLSQELRAIRQEAGLSQEQLADLASISMRPLYMFESGKGSIRVDTLLKLLDVLGFDLVLEPRIQRPEGP